LRVRRSCDTALSLTDRPDQSSRTRLRVERPDAEPGPRRTLEFVNEPGPLLASGRDADIFEYGPGLVLRKSRNGRSVVKEARLMEFVRAEGYPVPAVEEVSDDGLHIVMERINGINMVDALGKRPWTARKLGQALGHLHRDLHAIEAPDWVDEAPVGRGEALLHLDLHPLNVMLGPHGPVVIDWTNACRGDPAMDVALSWAIIAAGQVETTWLIGMLAGRIRSTLVSSFLGAVDATAARLALREAVTWKVRDANLSAQEQAAMWRLLEQVEAASVS
jgi:aminoglycoside phosphotransferase (APT) family kinase protein